MNIWHDVNPKRVSPESFISVIEISKGDKNKYELDKETGMLYLDRILHTSTHFPANYGFIPRTYGDDLDPLDVLLISSEPVRPLTLVSCYPIRVIHMIDDGRNDDKVIAIAFNDPSFNSYNDISDLPQHIFSEMSHFFSVYKMLEGKETSSNEISGRDEALKVIQRAIDSYIVTFCK